VVERHFAIRDCDCCSARWRPTYAWTGKTALRPSALVIVIIGFVDWYWLSAGGSISGGMGCCGMAAGRFRDRQHSSALASSAFRWGGAG